MQIKLPRLPAHEIAAARARASVLGLPRPQRTQPIPTFVDTSKFIPGWRASAIDQGLVAYEPT